MFAQRMGSPKSRLIGALALTGGVLLLLALTTGLGLAGGQRAAWAASNMAAGGAPAGQTAYEFVGRIDQDGANFVSYGYLTYVNGVPSTVLFSDPVNHSDTTARITYYATGTLTARSVISSVFMLNSASRTTIYFSDIPYANFHNPDSFRSGSQIAAFSGRNQDILNVQSPNQGVATNIDEMTQLSAGQFTFNAQTYTFGQTGLRERSWFTGEGTRTDAVTPKSFVVGAGNVIVTGYETALPVVVR